MAAASDVVSSDSEELILVDADDNAIGTLSKGRCHDGDGILHRAFSVFLFNADGELLLQQRSAEKRLWPLYWSNSCCSHPRNGETLAEATQRRILEELGVAAELEFVYKFTYHARYGDLGSEHECCSVYLGRTADTLAPNDNEIAAVRFVTPAALNEALATEGDRYTPWFKMEWQRLNDEFRDRLGKYSEALAG